MGQPSTAAAAVAAVLAAALLGTACGGGETNGLEDLAADYYDGGTGAVFIGVFEDGGETVAAVGVDGSGGAATPDRNWQTASLAKIVTATSIMRLVDEGRIDLDAPAADYTELELSAAVTVRHLLQHLTSVPSTNELIIGCADDSSLEWIRQTFDDPDRSAATSSVTYANANYIVLGRIIAEVTGDDSGHHIRDAIFGPLEMNDTYWYESQVGPVPYSKRADVADGEGLFGCDLGPTVGTDGGLVTTLHDMDKLLRSLFAGEIVSDSVLEEMTDVNENLFGYRFGLGVLELIDSEHPGDMLYGFGGDAFGTYLTAAFHDPAKRRTVVVYTTSGDQLPILWDAIDWADQQDE